MAKRSTARIRTKQSGLRAVLEAYFGKVKKAHRDGEAWTIGLPRNSLQLAEWITKRFGARGDTVEDTTVRDWENGRAMPEARYVGPLEQVLGAPWWWIDGFGRDWPPTAEEREVFSLVFSADADERQRVLARISRPAAATSSRAPRA